MKTKILFYFINGFFFNLSLVPLFVISIFSLASKEQFDDIMKNEMYIYIIQRFALNFIIILIMLLIIYCLNMFILIMVKSFKQQRVILRKLILWECVFYNLISFFFILTALYGYF